MRTEQVTCDGCGHDLTTRTNSVDYRLLLCSESKPGHGSGFYTDAMVYPPVERAHHFCGLGCLDHWSGRRRFISERWAEWHEWWISERGTEHAPGFRSYPSVSKEDRKTLAAEFEAAALVVFPLRRPFGDLRVMHPGDLYGDQA